jgi:cell division protein FtsX
MNTFYFISWITLVVRLAFAFLANWLYYNKTVRGILAISQREDAVKEKDESYSYLVAASGGTDKFSVMIAIGVIAAATFLISNIILGGVMR